ncbi:MAG: sugar ABC transporter ATP-binding protein [Lachnospiraceae bacterium]|uniref:sugar ABC transporter ATP-binding protein n=1 Tax=Candidatus Merdisoma sp. JLR.KK011 TaxID=3114299 RepID=UPI001433A729|nr:sugar ABC transporter ATP-binding protein [Lachnospiraceae bacterium]MCI9623237.1 sugar ABC transporter ATP-binding protein [Lachnospiraceae bacterium]GFI09756.1 ribose import ATP-binding protein RbsA [Lachnospiraceae bacterium]
MGGNAKAAGGSDYILECRDLSKSFGGTKALRNVELHIKKGEVHALVGENGAGKSTLMKAIIGLHKIDSGTITFEGKPYKVNGPAEAIRKGITMIHQELNPEPYLTVAENIFLHNEDAKGIFLNKKATNERAEKILKEFDFPISPTHLVGDLSLAQAQMIEIMKAVSSDAKLVIMDEPTSSLDNEETERLFQTIRQLKEKGVSVVYISHRMEEIFSICDTVSVFRDGQYIDCKPIGEVTQESLISMMVGREVKNVFPKTECEIGDVVFKVEGLTGKGFTDISFEVRKGEILGLTGLAGAGRSETMRAIFGLDPLVSGKMYMDGKEIVNKNPRQAINHGIAMVNEDRREYGLCLYRSISENISLPNLPVYQKGLLLNKRREKAENRKYAEMLTVKAASLEEDAIALSGGNQQKVVLAKWLMSDPKVLILDEPTRGVDVGAKSEIHSLMCEFARQGLAVIMISSELPEVMAMSDRLLVYHEGRINGELLREDIQNGKVTQETILAKEFGN